MEYYLIWLYFVYGKESNWLLKVILLWSVNASNFVAIVRFLFNVLSIFYYIIYIFMNMLHMMYTWKRTHRSAINKEIIFKVSQVSSVKWCQRFCK